MRDAVTSRRHQWCVLLLLLVFASHSVVTTMLSPCFATHQISSPERVERDVEDGGKNSSSSSGITNQTTARPGEASVSSVVTKQQQQATIDWIVIIFYNDDNILSIPFILACALALLVVILIATALYFMLRDDGSGKVLETQQEKSPNGSQVSHHVFHREPFDGKLATSAQMYHYQHQKQQILAAEHFDDRSEYDSDHEQTQDGVYTVYGCPGLASMEDMEVSNPHFEHDDDALSVTSAGDKLDKLEKFD